MGGERPSPSLRVAGEARVRQCKPPATAAAAVAGEQGSRWARWVWSVVGAAAGRGASRWTWCASGGKVVSGTEC